MTSNGSKPSVSIGLPTNGDVKMLTVCSLIMATNFLRTVGHDMALHVHSGPYTHWNREHIVNDALEAESDYLMFIDTDIVFPVDGITRLIDRGKDIIGGAYNLKQDDPVSTVKTWNDDRTAFQQTKAGPAPTEPFEVAAVATGFMLIRLDRLTVLKPPYFPCDFSLPRGEDVAFCLNAQEAGLEVWCDPTIDLRHVGDKLY